MPLAMSPAFKPEVEGLERMLDGLEVALEGMLDRLEGVLEGTSEVFKGVHEGLEEPGVEPGATSGESISHVKRGCESLTEERDKGDNSHHRRQTSCQCPNCSLSGMCCEYIIREENLETNCDVEESPIGDTYSHGNRVREPADQRQCQTQQILCHNRNSLGGRQSLSAFKRIFRPAKCRYI